MIEAGLDVNEECVALGSFNYACFGGECHSVIVGDRGAIFNVFSFVVA